MTSRRHQRKRRASILGSMVALLLGIGFSLVMVEVAARVMFPAWREFDNQQFMEPGDDPQYPQLTVGRRGFDGHFSQNNGDFRVRIHVNGFGLRNDEPIEAAADRVWAVGDSFTFGWGVERHQIFDAVLGERTNRPVYNVASPGTDICGYRALLRRMPQEVRPSAVIVGLTLENDIAVYDDCQPSAPTATPSAAISMTGVKLLLTRRSAAYNLLAVSLKRLPVVEEKLKSIGLLAREHADHSGHNLDTLTPKVDSSAEQLAILKDMLPPQTPFAVLLIPGRTEIRDNDPVFHQMRLSLTDALQLRGIATIDPFDALAREGMAVVHFPHDGHWSVRGHAIAGEAAAQWLQSITAAAPESAP